MTGNLPGAERAVLARVVARQDDLETTLVQVRADLDRVTRATASLTETLRKLPTADHQVGEEEPQRDWLSVTDPEAAQAWLIEATGWWDQVGTLLVGEAIACWPWHPRSVAAALALQAHYAQAYADPRAAPVSDLLTRWASALARMVSPRDAECTRHEHWQDGRAWCIRRDLLPDYAAWWASDRTGTPPGLSPRT